MARREAIQTNVLIIKASHFLLQNLSIFAGFSKYKNLDIYKGTTKLTLNLKPKTLSDQTKNKKS